MADLIKLLLAFLVLPLPFLIAYALAIGGTTGRTRRRVVIGGALALVLVLAAEALWMLRGLEGMS
jgi:hypothetical protein